jgi:hypothetical protein
MNPYRRHERFSYQLAADPVSQLAYESDRAGQREMMLGGIDYIEGNHTPAASVFTAEIQRLRMRTSEAKRRALVGADPLNLTGHTKGPAAKQQLANDPVERVGHITRSVPATNRLRGKNKLDAMQSLAADEYRDAYETVRAGLGGVMDFDRARGGSGNSAGLAEAVLIAGEKLRKAKALVGNRAIIIVEQIVCEGRGIEECTRGLYGYLEGEVTASRDVNYVGRVLREALTELSMHWHPKPKSRIRSLRPTQSEVTIGEQGIRIVQPSAYVAR